MSTNDTENPFDDTLPDDEEPILLTEEVLGDVGDEEDIIDLIDEVMEPAENDEGIIDLVDVVEDAPNLSVTPDQVEKALEKTIEKIYGERIESLLVEVVQRKVTAEIEKIKKTLHNA